MHVSSRLRRVEILHKCINNLECKPLEARLLKRTRSGFKQSDSRTYRTWTPTRLIWTRALRALLQEGELDLLIGNAARPINFEARETLVRGSVRSKLANVSPEDRKTAGILRRRLKSSDRGESFSYPLVFSIVIEFSVHSAAHDDSLNASLSKSETKITSTELHRRPCNSVQQWRAACSMQPRSLYQTCPQCGNLSYIHWIYQRRKRGCCDRRNWTNEIIQREPLYFYFKRNWTWMFVLNVEYHFTRDRWFFSQSGVCLPLNSNCVTWREICAQVILAACVSTRVGLALPLLAFYFVFAQPVIGSNCWPVSQIECNARANTRANQVHAACQFYDSPGAANRTPPFELHRR